MNAVWKDLDPIFKDTLRKYAIESNRLLFDVYAKAVGFDPSHVGLLYLTLKLEQDEVETRNSKRSYTESVDSDNEQHVHKNSISTQEAQTHHDHEEEHKENAYFQISVYNKHEDTSNNKVSNVTLSLPSLETERPSKRRKTCTNEIDYVEIQKEMDQNVDHEALEAPLPWIHSVICKQFESNTDVTNIPMDEHHTNNENETEDKELSEYERLKAFSTRFKHQKLPKSVVQNNRKKIALLANCDVYRESLMKRHSMMTRTRTIRHTSHTMATATLSTVANYTQNSNLLSSK